MILISRVEETLSNKSDLPTTLKAAREPPSTVVRRSLDEWANVLDQISQNRSAMAGDDYYSFPRRLVRQLEKILFSSGCRAPIAKQSLSLDMIERQHRCSLSKITSVSTRYQDGI